MSEPLDQPNSKPDKTWLSSLLLVLGIVSVIAALLAFLTGNILAGLSGLAICAILLLWDAHWIICRRLFTG